MLYKIIIRKISEILISIKVFLILDYLIDTSNINKGSSTNSVGESNLTPN